ncbi:hypothetical protein A9Q93_07995 [Nonlabens dokdonensis]|uniref:DUF5723 domain-containing protein n=1 Tax=Nonlabens dokdonensis TaxID=328515 RepID=A0A1Z8AW35_9FLAO|nr:DUF6588 family protein [Nonlabens dokdonensis]OUS14535.1 hypothetical protein A9Q93_07995 [Nonlabens dokdonensis]
MKNRYFVIFMILSSGLLTAQNGFSDILAAGVEAGERFSNSYMTPAAEAFNYNLSSGWYDDAKVLKPGKFKIQLKAQATFSPSDRKSFILDPEEYEEIIQRSYDNTNNPPANIEVVFGDGSSSPRSVATALGENVMNQQLIIRSREATTGFLLQEDVINLPNGIGNEGLDVIPTAFIQVGVGIGAGLELKGRIIPEVTIDEAKTDLYGVGLQWELSQLLSSDQNGFPLNISVLGGLTRLNASYDFEDGAVVDGENQSIETKINSFNFSAIVGTNRKVLNFYGGLNYNLGNTQTDLLGTYSFNSNTVIFPVAATVEDPFSVDTNVSGFLGTVGAKLTLGAFNVSADYTFGEFSTASASLFFRI